MKAILAFLFSNWKEWDYEECIRFFGCKVFQPLYRTTPDCMPHLLDEKNVRMLTSHKVFSEAELKSRCEIMLENYCKTVLIEANTMIDMAKTEIAPAVSSYVLELANTASAKKAVNASISCGYIFMGFIRGICSSYTHILWSWLIFLLVDILDIWHKRNLWHFYHDYRCCYRFYSMDMDNFFWRQWGT